MGDKKGIQWRRFAAIGFAMAFGFRVAAQDPFTIESPVDGGAYPEFGSVDLKVSVHFGDGTLRWFAELPNDDSRILLFTNRRRRGPSKRNSRICLLVTTKFL